MATLSLQFHARRDEVAQLAGQWVNEFGLWLAYETLTPAHRSAVVARGQVSGELRIPDSVGRVLLSFYPIEVESPGPFGLIGDNPTGLSILLGRESDSVLGESVLQALTDDLRSLSGWRRVRKSMAASFHKGAQVVNAATGVRSSAPDHYFSPGAQALYACGVRMAGLAELLSYEFDGPD